MPISPCLQSKQLRWNIFTPIRRVMATQEHSVQSPLSLLQSFLLRPHISNALLEPHFLLFLSPNSQTIMSLWIIIHQKWASCLFLFVFLIKRLFKT